MDTTREQELFIKIQNLNYMKNNEYSGPMADGYTMFGYQLNPQLGYQISHHLSIEGGIFLTKDFGNPNFVEVSPTYSLRYQKQDFKLVFGNLNGSVNHQLIEPLYNFERLMTNRLENGAQFMLTKKHYDFDIWINWLNMIYKRTNQKEKFEVGLSANAFKLAKNKWEFLIPLQASVIHRGGQLDTLKEGSNTYLIGSAGLILKYHTQSKLFENIYLDARYIRRAHSYFYDTLVRKDHGDGLLANIGFKSGYGTDLMFSYWWGNNFYNETGGFLYSSYSSTVAYPGYFERYRDLIIMRLTKKFQLAKNITLTIRAEPYYDIRFKYFEYSYGFYISLDEMAWLKKKVNFKAVE